MAVDYDKSVDYQALINEAVAKGDYKAAGRYEQQRNAKIADLGLDYDQTMNFGSVYDQKYLTNEQLGNHYQGRQDAAAGNTNWSDVHEMVEADRSKYGYSGGDDGSQYIELKDTYGDSGFTYQSSPQHYDQYGTSIDDMLNEILNRDAFSYDASVDPLYQQYKQQYQREGEQAMKNTLANVSARTGGLASSYATTAAQQANQAYAQQLADKIPELYQLAYQMYLDDIDLKVQDLGLLQNASDTEYSRYRDTLNDWYNDRDFAYGIFRDDIADERYQTEWDYNVGRDQIADQRYDQEWQYNVDRDKIADERYDQEWDYNVGRDQAADGRYDQEWAYQRAADMLDKGIMPNSDILNSAGISSSEAASWAEKATPTRSSGGGSGGGGGGGGPKTSDSVLDTLYGMDSESEVRAYLLESGLAQWKANEYYNLWKEYKDGGGDDEDSDGPSKENYDSVYALGIGPINAIYVNDLLTYGMAVEDANGNVHWAPGLSFNSFEEADKELKKRRTGQSNSGAGGPSLYKPFGF